MYLPVAVALFMHRIAQGDLCVNRSPVQLHQPDSQRAVSAEIRAANAYLWTRRTKRSKPVGGWLQPLHNGLKKPIPDCSSNANPDSTSAGIKLYPSLAVGMLQGQQETAGRIWLLCRALDQKGQGWLSIEDLRTQLSDRQSKLRVCGWRRLRQILQKGKGIFWERDDDNRLWLKSAEKVAYALGIEKISGTPIMLPLTILTQNIRIVRAHLYSSFHSSRHSAPISRKTLTTITGVPERTQREYDRLSNTTIESNIAIGGVFSAEAQQTEHYTRPGVFHFTDKQGKQGTFNQCYLAWRLPNNYQSVHKTANRGRQRKINRWLHSHTDLVINRAQGNSVETSRQRIFFDNPALSTKSKQEHYWRDHSINVWRVKNTARLSQLHSQRSRTV